jgi:hypothetical protein
VKDYTGIDWSPATSHIGDVFAGLWNAGKSGRPMQQLLIHLDALKDGLDMERFKAQIVEWLVTHFQRLLRIRRVRHDEWGSLVLELHGNGFLEHAGPLYNWCVWCDETGVFGAIHTSHVGVELFCCKCRRRVPYMAAFYSTGAFDQALELHDGMLAAALGWHLTRCGVHFEAGMKLPDTELDFVVKSEAGNCLIECKMNHLLGPDDVLCRTLFKNRDQLRDHLRIANGQGMEFRHAACVVNLTRDHLHSLLATMSPDSDREFARVRGQILSYEDVAMWLRQALAVSV